MRNTSSDTHSSIVNLLQHGFSTQSIALQLGVGIGIVAEVGKTSGDIEGTGKLGRKGVLTNCQKQL